MPFHLRSQDLYPRLLVITIPSTLVCAQCIQIQITRKGNLGRLRELSAEQRDCSRARLRSNKT